jgi:hypothetical protein
VPQWLALEPIVVLFAPIIVALVRAGIAQKQLERVCGYRGAFIRQLTLAIAIALLMVLEIATSVFVLANAPLEFWGLAILLYAAYFACISFALRPSVRVARSADGNFGDPCSS